MGMKVAKFGGSSLADAEHFRRVAEIVKADPDRHFVVASAPGKRFKEDVKVTDMLYQCYELVREGKDITEHFEKIRDRYTTIIADLGLDFDISGELNYILNAITHRSGQDFAASRGEYLNSLILAKYLGYDFVDAETVIFFRENGAFDTEKTNVEMQKELAMILREVKDPRIKDAFISITAVDVTGDLKFAKVYYSAMMGDKKEVAKGLKNAHGFIRTRLAQTLNLRQAPALTFVYDTSIENGAHIDKLLKGLTYSNLTDDDTEEN
jgi:ribosome-binding factor A